MLLKFTIANYRSIKDANSMDLEARSIKDRSENICVAQVGSKKIRLLKSIALIGNTAAGKSNWFKGFGLMRNMVLNSATRAVTKTYIVEPFALSSESDHKPTVFECTMIIKNIIYRYGFKCDNNEIITEWLTMKIKLREEIIFSRTKNEYQFVKRLPTDVNKKLLMITGITRKDALYLSVLTQFNIDIATQVSHWFSKTNFYGDLDLTGAINYTAGLLTQDSYASLIKEIIYKADPDTCLEKLIDEQFTKSPACITRIKYDAKKRPIGEVSFNILESESLGIQKLFALLGPVARILTDGGVFWVDDFDSQANPWIIALIIDLFNSQNYNKNKAQLVMVSYNQQLITQLRRDQTIFIGKNSFGESSLSLRKPQGFNDFFTTVSQPNKNAKLRQSSKQKIENSHAQL